MNFEKNIIILEMFLGMLNAFCLGVDIGKSLGIGVCIVNFVATIICIVAAIFNILDLNR